jgi:hypothetical protein
MDISQITTAEGKAYLYVAVERKTRYAYAELFEKMDAKIPRKSHCDRAF